MKFIKNGKNFFDEKEIIRGINICQKDGTLNKKSIGWSREPIFNCNFMGNRFKKKKWNYWYIINEDCLFSVTIAHLDYTAMACVYFYDFNTKEFAEKNVITPLGKGCNISKNIFEDAEFSNSKLQVVSKWNKYLKTMSIFAHCKDFKGRNLTAKFSICYPKGHETLNVLIPWSKNKFHFTSKQNCLPIEGRIMINNKTYSFDRSNSFATLDFGRGIWPFKIMWNWATASGNQQGRILGLNLGAKWTDGTGITENALLIDGKILKLHERILYDYDKNNFMKTWSIRTEISDKVNLIFKPIYDRVVQINAVLLKSTMHQIIGEFYGQIKDEQGNIFDIKALKGCTEEHYTRW